jgi:hypothetical protein
VFFYYFILKLTLNKTMKYLKYFKTEAEYNAFIQSEDFILPNVSYSKDADSVFYHIVKTETGDYKIYVLEKKNISGLSYNMVDLGLPSGLLWADRNVGAASSEDFGTYFAWGDTSGYNVSTRYCTDAELCDYLQPLIILERGDEIILTPDNIEEVLVEMGIEGTDLTIFRLGYGTDKCFSLDFSDYFDTANGGSTFNKYNINGGLKTLDASDDAATVNMGSEYRMPTKEDFEELINNCTVNFIDLQGIKLTGSNGNTIFIPVSGIAYDSILNGMSGRSYLWSSSLYGGSSKYARYLLFDYAGTLSTDEFDYRYIGAPARGVQETK